MASVNVLKKNIVDMDVDCIVNAANRQLMAGGGVCGAIFKAAHDPRLQQECYSIGSCPTGKAVYTNGYHLKAKGIIHAVGPIYNDGKHHEKELLMSTYKSAFQQLIDHKGHTLACPLISAGIYGYPLDEAIDISIETALEFIKENNVDIIFCVLDQHIYDKMTYVLQSKKRGLKDE